MNSKHIGEIGQLSVILDLKRRGYAVSIPYGDNDKYDLLVDVGHQILRVQVKAREPKQGCIRVELSSTSYTGNKIYKAFYSPEDVDVFAIFNTQDEEIYYLNAQYVLKGDLKTFTLRIEKTRNGQAKKIRFAKDYLDFDAALDGNIQVKSG